MKKLAALLMTVLMAVMMLCVPALGEDLPSITIGDVKKVVISNDNEKDGTGFILREDEEDIAYVGSGREIIRLEEAASPQEYFNAVNEKGEEVILTEMLENEDITVDELIPVEAFNYEPSMGNVRVWIDSITPYEEGQKVIVLFGFTLRANGSLIRRTEATVRTLDEAEALVFGTEEEAKAAMEAYEEYINVKWYALEGEAILEDRVELVLPGEMAQQIQDYQAFMAMVSAPMPEEEGAAVPDTL
ncbi:MAG: hypothetical protein Q4C54_01395 [Clostridia bacterium]|nr:hypothetical protein [Clostridia bacterium]